MYSIEARNRTSQDSWEWIEVGRFDPRRLDGYSDMSDDATGGQSGKCNRTLVAASAGACCGNYASLIIKYANGEDTEYDYSWMGRDMNVVALDPAYFEVKSWLEC